MPVVRRCAGAVAIAAALLCAGPALAANTFVDGVSGSDGGANNCQTASNPCSTVQRGINQAGAGETVHVEPALYGEQLILGDGKSLHATGTPASTIIDGTALGGGPAINVTGAGAGTIQGFTIRGSGLMSLRLDAAATVRGNIFDEVESEFIPAGIWAFNGSGSSTITENTFTDDGDGAPIAIKTQTTGSPTIADNRIINFFKGIEVSPGSPTVRGNLITGTHNSTDFGVGSAIFVSSSGSSNTAPTIVANQVRNPVPSDTSQVPSGIMIWGDGIAAGMTTGATLRRNRVAGHDPGINALNTDAAVTLDSDLVTGPAVFGITSVDTTEVANLGDISATNVTSWGNGRDFNLQDTHLTLNSTIAEDPIITTDSGGTNTSSCAITFSRGSASNPAGIPASCDSNDFATTQAPLFVGPSDFHLQSDSGNPAWGTGDPASPPVGTLDFDGDPRELPFNGTSALRREIGADEVIPTDYSAAETQINSGPSEGGTSSSSTSFGFSSVPGGATFQCSIDGAAFSTCTSPKSYIGLGTGSHTFAVRTVQLPEGNVDTTPATRTWTVDASAPVTQFDSGPAAGTTSNASPSFQFSSQPGSTFKCSLDGAPLSSCSSPRSFSDLSNGPHTLAVRATDGAGNAELSLKSRSWNVDAVPPATQIDSGPAESSTSSDSPSFGFSSEPGATFQCSLDGVAFSTCGSPQQYAELSDGSHAFSVRAIDPVGNVDASPAARSWNVDATSPDTRIDSGPSDGALTNARSASYGFSSEAGATFECSVDGGAFASCSSPRTIGEMTDGNHVFTVRARDATGNADATPATRSLTVDTDAPEGKISKVKVKGDDAKAKFTSDEPGSTFLCRLDKKKFKPCTSPRKLKNLDDGKHKLFVQATDPVGNVDPTAAKKKFEVEG